MGPQRVPVLGAFNWVQSNNNVSRINVPLKAWVVGRERHREKTAGFEDVI